MKYYKCMLVVQISSLQNNSISAAVINTLFLSLLIVVYVKYADLYIV